MADPKHQINYASLPNLTFATANEAKKYLLGEREAWQPFLEMVRVDSRLQNLHGARGALNAPTLANIFTTLLDKLEDIQSFNRLVSGMPSRLPVPPPASSIEGQLILGLHTNGQTEFALMAYVTFIRETVAFNTSNLQPMTERGRILIEAAHAAAALPFRQSTSQQLAGMLRTAQNRADELKGEVQAAQAINQEHDQTLSTFREATAQKAKRLEVLFSRLEKRRQRKHTSWMASIDQELASRLGAADVRIEEIEKNSDTTLKDQKQRFDALYDLFHAQLRLKEPVELWRNRAEDHKKKSSTAFKIFIFLTLLATLVGVFVPYCFGDYIASSFFTQVCSVTDPQECLRQFSAKGPLTVGGLLMVMSLALWAIRLQYRVYLSERHLSLDASEKEAFAQTYLAMKEGAEVDASNEAIVLASLFRPTQDGIIKDDDSAMDVSMVAILAKQLGRTPN